MSDPMSLIREGYCIAIHTYKRHLDTHAFIIDRNVYRPAYFQFLQPSVHKFTRDI